MSSATVLVDGYTKVSKNGGKQQANGAPPDTGAPNDQSQKPRHRSRLSYESLPDSLADLMLLPLTPGAAIKHVLKECVMVAGLAFKLMGYLGMGWKWFINFNKLLIYATLLMPGFAQCIMFYFFSKTVIRSIPYGKTARQRADIYLPNNMVDGAKYPVVIFVTGGAWTIGYKAWGALLSKRLAAQGVVVACLDYKNFPQGDAKQMLEDVNTGIAWVCQRIGRFQGDTDNIVLVGQSAGGQLAALTLLKQVEREANGYNNCNSDVGAYPEWSPASVKAFVGISGAYDLTSLSEHLHQRGLYKSLFAKIMSVDGRLAAYDQLSPFNAAKTMPDKARLYMPPVLLIHGDNDKSVPHASALKFHEALVAARVDSTCKLIQGKGHTSFLIQGPMSAGRDLLMDLVLQMVTGKEEYHEYPMMCPKFLCDLADWISPF